MSPPRERISSSPVVETLPAHDIAQMRARALQMGLNSEDVIQPTPRERELFDMVLRLTNPNLVSLDPSQLVHQAEAIADLVHQRDYLARRVEEERSRWESEKEGWDRISEALLVRRSRKVNGPDESELKRMCQSLEFDNKALKEKLTHTQGRVNALEAELTKLKPHLLMQPFVPRSVSIPARSKLPLVPPPSEPESQGTLENTPLLPSTQPQPADAATITDAEPTNIVQPPSLHALAQASSYFTSLPFPSLQNVTSAANRKKKLTAQLKKALHPNTTIASSAPQSASSAPVFPTPPASARTVLNTPGPPPRKLGRPAKARRAPPQLFASDARAEHLLIAARRLGRERAGIVAGVISAERERMDHEKVEREKERIEREKERIEREKRNRGGGGYYRERPGPEPASKSGTASESPKRNEGREGSDSRFADAMAGYVNAAGQSASSDAKGKGKSASTSTPLDSLLDAARSMQHGGNGAEPPTPSTSSISTGMMTRRRTATNDQAGTPAPKRRRLSSNASDTPSRARTALDVLADQAAVVGSSDTPGKGKGKGKAKGKGKGVADELADNAVPIVKRKRGRPPNKDRNKPSPATASSTSRLISPASSAGPSHTNGETGESSRPVTRWVQRGRLAGSASSRPPPRQRDDVESEDEPDEPMETDKVAKPAPALAQETEQERAPPPAPEAESESILVPGPVAESAPEPPVESENVDPVIQPTAVIAPLPLDEVAPSAQDNTVVTGHAETQIPGSPPMLEDPVLDADADGEDDPDVDMDGTNPSLL
ncbi:hypothetical protein DFH06DRAFT_1142299 [Mycena polygramma]|nr:hypothetical protein DFH06DRAFT_1142299 [Mycena polygramma]